MRDYEVYVEVLVRVQECPSRQQAEELAADRLKDRVNEPDCYVEKVQVLETIEVF